MLNVEWKSDSFNEINAYSQTPTYTEHIDGATLETTTLENENPFGGWSGKPQDSLKTQFMFSFLDETDENQALF